MTTIPVSGERRSTLLWSGVVLLVGLVVLAPFRLAALGWGGYPDVGALADTVTAGFVRFAATGSLSADLSETVNYWQRFHLIKALLAAALLVLLLAVGSRIWGAYARTPSLGRRTLLGLGGLLQSGMAVLALVIAVANIQGALVPLSSVLGLMPLGGDDAALNAAVAQIASHPHQSAFEYLLADFARYHAMMVAIGAMVTIGLLMYALHLLRRRVRLPKAERRMRWVLLAGTALTLVLAAFFALITAANLSTWIEPLPALLGFLNGGG